LARAFKSAEELAALDERSKKNDESGKELIED
jgi:hypothetical protein